MIFMYLIKMKIILSKLVSDLETINNLKKSNELYRDNINNISSSMKGFNR